MGWSTTQDGANIVINSAGKLTAPWTASGTDGQTLYAVWEAKVITLNLTGDASTTVNDSEVFIEFDGTTFYADYDGETLTNEIVPMAYKDGYIFSGFTMAGGTLVINNHGAVVNRWNYTDTETDLTATFNADTYTITFVDDDDDSTELGSVNYITDSTVNLLQPTRDGYTLSGWRVVDNVGQIDEETYAWTADEFIQTFLNFSTVGRFGDVTLEAVWANNEYTIIYVANVSGLINPETLGGSTPSTLEHFDQQVTIANNGYTIDGYKFLSWNTQRDGLGTPLEEGQKGVFNFTNEVNGTYTLYAQWQIQSYTLTLEIETEGIESVSARGEGVTDNKDGTYTVVYGSQVTLTANVKKGYTFSMWRATSGTIAGSVLTMPAVNTTVFASATPQQFAVSYQGNEGTIYNGTNWVSTYSVSVDFNATITLLDETSVQRTGYTFTGWNTEVNGTGTPYAGGALYTHQTTGVQNLYAQWTPNTYTVNFDAPNYITYPYDVTVNGGSVKSEVVANELVVTYTADDSATGFTVSTSALDAGTYAWTIEIRASKALTLSTLGIASEGLSSDVKISTDWQTFVLTFDLTSGNNFVLTTSELASGDFIEFKNLAVQKVSEINSDTALGNLTVTYNSTYENLPTPTRNGYTFLGWNTLPQEEVVLGEWQGSDTQINSNSTVSIAQNHTLYSWWSYNQYTINYNANDANYYGTATGSTASTSAYYDNSVQLSACGFNRDGYTFKGWTLDPEGEGTLYTAGQQGVFNFVASGSVTLYAQWTPITYHIIVRDSDTESPATEISIDAPFASTLSEHILTNVSAYTKDGWTLNGFFVTNGDEISGTSLITKDGYLNMDVDGITDNGMFIHVGDVVVTAVYTPNPYTVVFNGNARHDDTSTPAPCF